MLHQEGSLVRSFFAHNNMISVSPFGVFYFIIGDLCNRKHTVRMEVCCACSFNGFTNDSFHACAIYRLHKTELLRRSIADVSGICSSSYFRTLLLGLASVGSYMAQKIFQYTETNLEIVFIFDERGRWIVDGASKATAKSRFLHRNIRKRYHEQLTVIDAPFREARKKRGVYKLSIGLYGVQ
jgi:hypothetical protein